LGLDKSQFRADIRTLFYQFMSKYFGGYFLNLDPNLFYNTFTNLLIKRDQGKSRIYSIETVDRSEKVSVQLMSKDHQELQVYKEAPSPGRPERLRIFIESIARAGLLAIPVVGSAIEKASFGFKDALASADLQAIVRLIETELRRHTLENQTLSEEAIQQITKSVLASPGAKALAEAIESASLRTTNSLTEILLQIADLKSIDQESARLAMTEFDKLQAGQYEILHNIRRGADLEQEILNQIFLKLDQLTKHRGRRPKELLQTLESLEAKRMLRNVGYIWTAALHIANRPEPFVTTDLSEIFGYINWPSEHEDIFLADAALFEINPDPVYLLPGTTQELDSWLELISRKVFSSAGKLAIGRIEHSLLPFHLLFPIDRLLQLFEKGRLSKCPVEEPSKTSDQLHNICFEVMREAAPKRNAWSVAIDCYNLAFLCVSIGKKWLANRAPVLVSRDRFLPIAENALKAANLLPYPIPLIAHPIEWSYDTFLRQGRSMHPIEKTSFDGQMIKMLLPILLETLHSPTPDRVFQLKPLLPLLKYSLMEFGEHFAALANWFASDVHWESHSRWEIGRTHDWKEKMIQTHRVVMAALSDLESHVLRMKDAYEPFIT
jgi:hypothetical protein